MKEGLLIPVRSSNDIYVAIAKLLDNPDLALSLGRAARLKFESTFSIDKMHSNFVALFDLSVDGT
jgi:glycosyltransferase involved in cell wall biosynthesis